MTDDLAQHWGLDPEITFLNHGSFGACPKRILALQHELQLHIEREPVAFFMREFEGRVDAARTALARLIRTAPHDLALITNATEGVNTVLRSIAGRLQPGDELLTTDHVYNACRNAMQFVAEHAGAQVSIVPIPFPVESPARVVETFLSRVTDRTKLVLMDHVTSPTGLVLPVEQIVPTLRQRGIETLVDGAHAPGMLDLDIQALAPTYYTGNCHKWLCTPKGAAFLYVQEDHQHEIRPLSISHGANSPRTDRSRFLLEFDWPGTADPTAWLCIPASIEFLGDLLDGGLPALRRRNKELVLDGRRMLCEALGIDAPAPASMIGSLAALPIPDGRASGQPNPLGIDPLQDALFREDRIEVPVMPWPAPPHRLLRISAQAYNRPEQYARLAEQLPRRLAEQA